LVPEENKDPVKQREAGASWQFVPGVEQNVAGFLEGLDHDGWNINFNWGATEAWVSDWKANNNNWVDAADIVYYKGHASLDSWVLFDPEAPNVTTYLSAPEIAKAEDPKGDRYGNGDLEWLIIAACGPLQDKAVAPAGGDAFQRWQDIFDGLHQLLGFASVSFSTLDEGKLFVRYCCVDEATVINSWFRATKEAQPPETFAAVMYACCEGEPSPLEDHLWGHGFVTDDPKQPTQYVAMWSPC